MIISQSSLKLYKRCPQAYYYKKVKNLVPRHSALPLQRGIILHSALEAYYKKEDWTEAIESYRKWWDELMEEEKAIYGDDLLEECTKIMENYCIEYGDEPTEKVLACEIPLEKDEQPIEILPGLFFDGRIDLIVQDGQGIWLMEHKSHKKIPSEETRFLNVQSAIYEVAAEKMGYKVDGICWNYIRTKVPTVPRALVKGGISRAKNIDTDYRTYLKAIEEAGEDPKKYTEELEATKQNKFFERVYTPKNETTKKAILADLKNIAPVIDRLKEHPWRALDPFSCKGCGYKTLCQAELLGLDTEFILKKDYTERKEEEDNVNNYEEE